MAVSGDELRDAARLARESVVVGRAVTLARWIGTGRRPVTAGQVLPKADVPVAGAALGVPPTWSRVRLPVMATLGDLYDVIQVLFGWDGDHLHVFQAGKKQHSDPLMDLDGTRNEEAIRLRNAMARNDGKISYTYDLGASRKHEITLEQTLPCDRGQDYPVCVAYKGGSPVEYWCEDDPEEPEPFDRAEVNRKLARARRGGGVKWHLGPRTTVAASRRSPPSSSAARN